MSTQVKLPNAGRSYFEQARALLTESPTERESVQILDEKIEPIKRELEEIQDETLDLKATVREKEQRVNRLVDELDETRVEIVMGDAPSEAEAAVQDRLDEAKAELEDAQTALRDHQSSVSSRKSALQEALSRLEDRREAAVREAKEDLLDEAGDVVESLALIATSELAKAYQLAMAAHRLRQDVHEKAVNQGWGEKELPGGGRRRPETFVPTEPEIIRTVRENSSDVEAAIDAADFEVEALD